MKYSQRKSWPYVIILLALVGSIFFYRSHLGQIYKNLFNQIKPCSTPITYSLGDIDSKFGLSKTTALADIAEAEKIWESAAGKNLFEYSATGNLKINFIYDYRQQATQALQKIGVVMNNDKASYDALKAKYNELLNSYNQDKKNFEALLNSYNSAKAAYEKKVAYWNSRGGVPPDQYATLEAQRVELNNQVDIINQKQDDLNNQIDTINSSASILNQMITELNLQVATYNNIGASTGKKFNEGEYISDASGVKINIYEFNSKNQLVRVLAHELGHALGLDHVNNPKAIMYYLNEGGNEKLTADDISALKKICL